MRLWETAHFIYRDRMESLANPEEKRFTRAESGIWFRRFKVKAILSYPDGRKQEKTTLILQYQDIDFSWNWMNENKLCRSKTWKPSMVGALLIPNFFGRTRFLAKCSPSGSINLDLGTVGYVDEDRVLHLRLKNRPASTEASNIVEELPDRTSEEPVHAPVQQVPVQQVPSAIQVVTRNIREASTY